MLAHRQLAMTELGHQLGSVEELDQLKVRPNSRRVRHVHGSVFSTPDQPPATAKGRHVDWRKPSPEPLYRQSRPADGRTEVASSTRSHSTAVLDAGVG